MAFRADWVVAPDERLSMNLFALFATPMTNNTFSGTAVAFGPEEKSRRAPDLHLLVLAVDLGTWNQRCRQCPTRTNTWGYCSRKGHTSPSKTPPEKCVKSLFPSLVGSF